MFLLSFKILHCDCLLVGILRVTYWNAKPTTAKLPGLNPLKNPIFPLPLQRTRLRLFAVNAKGAFLFVRLGKPGWMSSQRPRLEAWGFGTAGGSKP